MRAWRRSRSRSADVMSSPVDSSLTPLAVTVSRPERVFPTLTREQVSRIAAHGRRRSTTHGDVLVEVGDKAVPIFVVVGGELQAVLPAVGRQKLVLILPSGRFDRERL